LFDIDTVAEDDAEPPDPVHSIVSVFSPMLSKDIDSVPEIDFAPLQSPLAEQAVELVDDQVTETASYMKAELGSIEIVAVGLGGGGGGAAGSPPPPPPPPPHDVINIEVRIVVNKKLVFFIMNMCFLKIYKKYIIHIKK
jgi:hypothetical protein